MDYVNIILYVSYALVVVGTVLSVLLPLIKSLDDPKGLMKSGLGVVAIVVSGPTSDPGDSLVPQKPRVAPIPTVTVTVTPSPTASN